MNLLSRNQKQEDILVEHIFDALKGIGITSEEMSIAEKFFDFSKELDITLLENLKCRKFPNANYDKAHTAFEYIKKQEKNIYYDRYILFLDAIMGNEAIYGWTRYISSFAYNYKYHKEEHYTFIIHAYIQRYSEAEVEAKLSAIFALACDNNIIESEYLREMAQKNPEALYEAYKHYCVSSYCDSKIRLCALALAYNSPEKKMRYYKGKVSRTVSGKLSNEHTKEMAKYIVFRFDVNLSNMTKDNVFDLLFPAMFMAIHFDDRIEDKLKANISGREKDFLIALFKNISCPYFDENVEKIGELIKLDNSEEFTEEFIKTAINCAWSRGRVYSNDTSGENAEIFLKYCSEHYAKSMAKVMYSMEQVPQLRSGSWVALKDKYYCCYYDEIFNLFKEYNPQALTDYNIHYNDDIMRLVVESERLETDIAKDEIEKYLRGEAELSVLEPYYDKLASSYHSNYWANNETLAILCMDCFPKFTKRYYSLKAIQAPEYVVRKISGGNYDEREAKFKALLGVLNEDKVPAQYRFDVYSRVIDNIYYDSVKADFGNDVLESMLYRKDRQDSEYKSICPNGGVFTRKTFLRYLAATDDENNSNKSEIIKMFGDSSKEVRRTLVEVLSDKKQYESDVIELLKAKKAATREAAVDVIISWGAENYKDILLETADNEKSAKLADKIRDALSIENPKTSEGKIISPTALVEELHKGGRNKKILWLYAEPIPKVHFKNGNEADDKYLQAIMLCYSSMPTFGVSDKANILAEQLNEDELKDFVAEILSRWLSDGAESKKKWVLNFVAIHGGTDMIDVFLRYIKEWSENMRGAIAAEAVKALAMNGSSQALMAIDNMAHKFKHKQVKNAAIQALDSAAEALGITSDELADRIVPDLGFDENMQRIFDYGTRKFKVYLTPSLELEVFDENDKKLKNIPAPGKRDDEKTAKKSNAEFKAMKKQLKNVISIQKMRLETAILADRRWDKSAWEALFVKNPVMHNFAIGLIWASYENDKLSQTFRYMEDGTFNTADEDEYELPENAVIGLVHPIDLDEDTLSAWKEQLEDYEITQPIEQLNRPVYLINDDEIGKLDLERFEGREINGMSLLGRTSKYGWQKGSVQDAGCFSAFYREDITKRIKNEDGTVILEGNAVELNFEGMYVGGEDMDVKIEKVRFYKPGTVTYGSYVYDHANDDKAISLEKISPRYFSEIINQLEAITRVAENKE